MTSWKKYTSKAAKVAAKYNTPSLPKETWSRELGIPLKNFDHLPPVVSWGYILREEAKKK